MKERCVDCIHYYVEYGYEECRKSADMDEHPCPFYVLDEIEEGVEE